MIELVSAGLALLWGVCVLFRGLAGELGTIVPNWRPKPRPLTSSPIAREYRHIGRLGGRVVALRVQLVIA